MNFVQAFRPALAAAICCLGCSQPSPVDQAIFLLAPADSGLDFVHFNGMTGEMYYSEVVGAGAALFDADNDGDLDLYLVQGNILGPGKSPSDALEPPKHAVPLHDRLYQNRLVEDGELKFRDITVASGFDQANGYGMGVATGDFDNDGWTDLYVTNLGDNQLWRNTGLSSDGTPTFHDVTATAGSAIADPRWSTSAAFLDIDRDGWLDLYVTNYVDYRPEHHKGCLDQGGAPEYCGPHSYSPVHDRLLRNRGDGSFEDISAAAGILTEAGSGLGVITADIDGNGYLDIYVANDLMRNHLWLNQMPDSQDNVSFHNHALIAGTAVGARGQVEASMGIDAGDLDNDGDLDLFLTHMDGETNTLYVNDGSGHFLDQTGLHNLAEPSRAVTGFGTAFLDVDNDGWIDIATANGAVKTIDSQRRAGLLLPLREHNQLFLNQGESFVDVSTKIPAFLVPEVSRGLASGDVDNDGDTDLLVTNNNGPARLLINQIGHTASWIGLQLADTFGKTPSGALVHIPLRGADVVRRASANASYCSARDPRVLVGLGARSDPVTISITWPSGRIEFFDGLHTRRYHTLKEGSGRPRRSVP